MLVLLHESLEVTHFDFFETFIHMHDATSKELPGLSKNVPVFLTCLAAKLCLACW